MSKSYVGMGYSVCPVCGKKEATSVVLDKRMRDRFDSSEQLVTDIALCKEHKEQREQGQMFLIEVSNEGVGEKLTLEKADRTGRGITMPEEVAKELFNKEIPENGILFCDQEVLDMVVTNLQ